MSNTCQAPVYQDGQLVNISKESTYHNEVRHTDPGNYDHVAVLPFAHHRQDGFDDVDICEEVDLEDLINEADGTTALCQFFNGSNDSYRASGIS